MAAQPARADAPPMTGFAPLVLEYAGVRPRIGAGLKAGPGSAVLGRVELGDKARLGPRAVIRADGHFVRIGSDFVLGARSTVHIAHDAYPTVIGDRVAVGENACVHACTVGNDCVVEDDVVVLDGSVVDDHVVLTAGSVVYPRSTLPGGLVYAGIPAKPVRPSDAGEIATLSRALADRAQAAREPAGAPQGDVEAPRSVFVARTALVAGRVRAADAASIFFSCDFEARDGEIAVGENTNVQDNTVVKAFGGGSVVIGRDTTIGHNVRIENARIGERVLLGIGSIVAPDTVVEEDVLLAAGAWTEPGQTLEAGWLWAGRPARPLSRMRDDRRASIADIIRMYCIYARQYAVLQGEAA